MNDLNAAYFSKDDVKAGLFDELLKTLIDYGSKSKDGYCDIRVRPGDSGSMVVEWAYKSWGRPDALGFAFTDEDHILATVCRLPDNSEILCRTDREAEDLLADFLKENPYYEKDEYGFWRDMREQTL